LLSASGALVLIGFLFHDKREPSGLRPPAGFFLDQENSLASGGPFPRSRKLSGVWQAFSSIKKTLWRLAGLSSIKKTLWRLADLFLDQENPLASGGPFPRSRKLSGVWQAFSSIKKTLWCLAGLFLDKENPLVLGWH
jgi:hypothetical protein